MDLMRALTTLLALALRHAISALGLSVYLSGEDQQKLVGAAMIVAGVAWSILQKPTLRQQLRRLVPFLGLLLVVGCASTATVSLEFSAGAAGEGNFAHNEAAKAILTKATITRSAYGRDCFDVVLNPDTTEVQVTHAVDASSDWAGIRVLPAVVPETLRAVVTSVVSVIGAPIDVLMAMIGSPRPAPVEMTGPSGLSACSALFES